MNGTSTSTLIVLPVYNTGTSLPGLLDNVLSIGKDLLIIDDGSTDRTSRILEEYSSVKVIRHELSLGIGASIIHACEYARDMSYDFMISLDTSCNEFSIDIERLIENLAYGYDIITCSRILENYDHAGIKKEFLDIVSALSSHLLDITGYDITDPLSGIKGIRVDSLKSMELSDFGHGLFLQLFIQARYYGLNVLEIPANSGKGFAIELDQYNDPVGHFLSIMETERNLYPRSSTN
jgi:glycosyltransferase involved in cell wall biosynthesis